MLWAGCVHSAQAATNPKILHLLNRLSFGPRPGDIDHVKQIGINRYIQEQLAPETLPLPAPLRDHLASLNTLQMTPLQLAQVHLPQRQGVKLTPEEQKATRQKARQIPVEAVEGRLRQAIDSPRQLQEVMVNFWYNHFNVYAQKGLTRLWFSAYEQEAIRPFALGRFRDLLEATARHPAMLVYLDNWQNTAPNSSGVRGNLKGINENYARELLELHTLGVDGGYTQQDVTTLARILTGWGLPRLPQASDIPSLFYFDPKRHDFSDKVFLGYRIRGSGEAEVEQVLDILAKSPATARHISYQLAQYFVADQPPKPLVDRLSQRFLSSDGNIRKVLKTLFTSPEFWDSKYYQAKFKTPYEYVVSAIRVTGVDVPNFPFIANTLQQMGMPLYMCFTPDGYKNTQDAWLNSDAINRRINFATLLASGHLPLRNPPGSGLSRRLALEGSSLGQPTTEMVYLSSPSLRRSTERTKPIEAGSLLNTLGNTLSAQTEQAIATSPPALRAALILGSPEFMHR